MDQNSMYPAQTHPATHMIYGHNPEEAYSHYQHNMAQVQQQPLMERQSGMSQQEIRPMSQHGFHEVQPYPVNYSNGIPQYPVQHQQIHHMRHPSEQYEGSPAPEDSSNETGGARRKKGNATSMANDQELRRLLQQYGGKTLVEVAQEVQKSEGSGGKSEKAKQVFAMLW
jgi:regulatory factor X